MAEDNSPATAAWLPSYSYPSVDHMFDLNDALSTLPPVILAAVEVPPPRFVEKTELPLAVEAEDVVCSICTEGFKPGSGDGKRVPCGHVYHSACISTWLSRFNSCPLCRAQLLVA